MGLLVGVWSIGRSAGWSLGWLAGHPVSRQVTRLVGRSPGWSVFFSQSVREFPDILARILLLGTVQTVCPRKLFRNVTECLQLKLLKTHIENLRFFSSLFSDNLVPWLW